MRQLQIPRVLWPFEKYNDRRYRPWRGCNHCGRYVPRDCRHVVFHYQPDLAELYHEYCYLKLYRRDYAMRVFGPDLFADDPWEKMRKPSSDPC
jgi:hypothetical protein